MKILLSYAGEYDTGEGAHISRVLVRLGHEVVNVNIPAVTRGDTPTALPGFSGMATLEDLLAAVGGADLYLYVEPFGLIPRGLERAPIPTACILCDTHRNPRARQTIARLFDHVFVYHRNHLAWFTDRHPDTLHWLPFACDTDVVRDQRAERDLDVAFIGRPYTRERRSVIASLGARYRMNEQRAYRQAEIPGVYSRARIVLDLPDGDNITFRVFEAMSCGALLITRRIPSGIEALFEEGVHYAAFSSRAELDETIARYLADDERREAVAKRGCEAVHAHHTLERRLQQLLAAVAAGPKEQAPVRAMARMPLLRTYGRVLERMGRVETLQSWAASESSGKPAAWLLNWYAARACARRAVLHW